MSDNFQQKDNNKMCDGCCVNVEVVNKIKKNMMNEEMIYDIADFFKTFGDSTRLKIICALLNEELCVGDLSEILQISQSAISHQLRVLRQNNLVKFKKQGKTVLYSLDDDHVSILVKQGIEHILHKKVYE